MGQRDRIAAFLHLAQEELDAASWLVERTGKIAKAAIEPALAEDRLHGGRRQAAS